MSHVAEGDRDKRSVLDKNKNYSNNNMNMNVDVNKNKNIQENNTTQHKRQQRHNIKTRQDRITNPSTRGCASLQSSGGRGEGLYTGRKMNLDETRQKTRRLNSGLDRKITQYQT